MAEAPCRSAAALPVRREGCPPATILAAKARGHRPPGGTPPRSFLLLRWPTAEIASSVDSEDRTEGIDLPLAVVKGARADEGRAGGWREGYGARERPGWGTPSF